MGRRPKRLHRPWLNWLASGALVLLVCALCTIAASGGSQHTSAQAPTLNTPYRAGAPRAAAETPGYTFSEAANEVYPQRRHHARVGRPTSLPPNAAVAARLAMAVSRAPRVARAASGPTPTGRDPDQLASLRALYAGTAGPLWTRAVNWTATDNYCLFAGVDCDDTGNVVRLILPDNNIRGTLTSSMLNLPTLRTLDLSENFLKGVLPPVLYDLNQLEELDLSTNFLSGTVSSRVSNWTQLQRLHLAQNHLTGTLPAGITASPRLRHLLLGMNQFTGYVPQGWGLLPQLRVLSVIGNDLSGPMPNVMNNSELEFLDVSFNRFDGNLVPLFALNQLRLLRVNSNHLTGPFPSEVLHFPKLHSLYMSRNLLSCKLPAFPAPFLKQFGGENFDILIGNHWECPIPPILASIDTHYDEYFCGMGWKRFYIVGVCCALFVIAGLAHTCPWRGPNKPVLGKLPNFTDNYHPGLEASTYISVITMASWCLTAMMVMAAILMFLYSQSSSPYNCRYILTASAAYVTGSPSAALGMVHVAFIVAVLWWLSAVRAHRRNTWGKRTDLEAWLPLVNGEDRRAPRSRCTWEWFWTKIKFAGVSTMIYLIFSLVPNIAYCFIRAQAAVSLDVKRGASVIIALYTAVVNVNLAAKFASLMMTHFFAPRSSKHRFEVSVRLAGWFVVLSSLVSPWLASVLMADNCLFHRIKPRPSVLVPVDEHLCARFSVNGTCIDRDDVILPAYEPYVWHWDQRCPSSVLELYGSVWVIGLMFQGLVGTAFRLIEDRLKHNESFSWFALQTRQYLFCREKDSFGTASESYLHGLVSRYSQIIDNLSVVVVFGSVYPMIIPAGFLAIMGRTFADGRLVRKALADGSHARWIPQDARGLPSSAVVLMLVLYSLFLAFFFGLGMLPSVLYWLFLLPITLLGLIAIKFQLPEKVGQCCAHVSSAANARPPAPMPARSASSRRRADDDGGLGYRQLSAEELAKGAMTEPIDAPTGFARSRSGSDGSLTGVGGRLLVGSRTPTPSQILDDIAARPGNLGSTPRHSQSNMPTLTEEEAPWASTSAPGHSGRSSRFGVRRTASTGRRSGHRLSGSRSGPHSADSAASRRARWLLAVPGGESVDAGSGQGGQGSQQEP